jgi:ABC-2 type transport system permease protein
MHVAVLDANVRKVLIELRRYLPNTISMMVTFYAIFLAMFLGISVIGDPAATDDHLRFAIVGNAFWFLLLLGINSMGYEVATEATRGTLEQVAMSPVGMPAILLARMVGTFGAYLVITAIMLVLTMATARQWLNLDVPLLLAILLPTFVGVMGIGLAVAGLAIVYKQVGAILQMAQFVFLGMAFVPLAVAPWLELGPIVKGIDMVRAVMIDGAGFARFGLRDWGSLLASGVVYFLLGLLAYRAAEGRAVARGLLGQY